MWCWKDLILLSAPKSVDNMNKIFPLSYNEIVISVRLNGLIMPILPFINIPILLQNPQFEILSPV